MRFLIGRIVGLLIFLFGLYLSVSGKMRFRINLAIMAVGLLIMLNIKKKKAEDEDLED